MRTHKYKDYKMTYLKGSSLCCIFSDLWRCLCKAYRHSSREYWPFWIWFWFHHHMICYMMPNFPNFPTYNSLQFKKYFKVDKNFRISYDTLILNESIWNIFNENTSYPEGTNQCCIQSSLYSCSFHLNHFYYKVCLRIAREFW